ncbi:MAG: hypothetical protein MJ182_06015 [Treponema sp.]|nr:hypothetical protein [Treponema sp.]
MKKLLAVLACLTVVAGVFAQSDSEAYKDPQTELEKAQKLENEKLVTQTINVPEGFVEFKDKAYMSEDKVKAGGNIYIEYSPLYNEVRIYYTCLMTQYERGQAMNDVLAVLQDFTVLNKYINSEGKEFTKERYYHYSYLVPDKEKYFRDGRFKKAQYISYVKFSK